ncbi:AAA family ATPase [Paenibacillus sp. 19GGS1-52]|uniref:ATP-dependent nuclease n=1 Tax=Paenibacillus sp. 19GGS1-52 TaxID=2758563 RepID=UPI001EFA37C5|nr:AAA family ATPase [Paenibacillus sp. 19GGS1-52]ULO04850.1 AAA family ATPase [Paenibacillus sp. 19GGS1-52]
MRIEELHIKNFRNFDEKVTIVPRKINEHDIVVLIGENNVGKTSILTILHSLFNPERSIRTLEFQETDFYNPEFPIEVNIIFSDLSEEVKAVFIGMVDIKIVDGDDHYFLPFTFKCVYDKDTKEVEPSLVYERQPERSVSFSEKRLISFYFQDALRDHRAIKSNKGSLFGRILDQIDLSNQEEEILGKLDEAGETLNENTDISELIKGVASITRQVIDLSDKDGTVRLTVAASSATDIKRNIQLQLRHRNEEKYLNIDQLGLGLQSVLTVSVFRAFAGIGKLREGIFAIDEPESHLYPHSQRAMYREVLELSKSRQVWVATHSPTLIEWINPKQICLVRKQPNGDVSTCIQLPAKFPNAHIASYEKHLDVGKADAFFAKAVLLVEGPTEQGLFPALGIACSDENNIYDLDRVGVSVINTGGKNNLKAFIQLLNNFNIPNVAMIDYDSVDENHEKVIKEIKEECSAFYEIPRNTDMGDIEGLVCLHVPIEELLLFLKGLLPAERMLDLFSDLKGAISRFDKDKGQEIRALRKAEADISECFPILESVPDAEESIRKCIADSFRKIKGRTTGRLIGEVFYDHFPQDFIDNTLSAVMELAGYNITKDDKDKDSEKKFRDYEEYDEAEDEGNESPEEDYDPEEDDF